MTVHLCGAALAFFAFAVSLIIGLYVGNPFVTVVMRSLFVLIVAYIVGAVLTSLGQRAVLENIETEIADFHAKAESDQQDGSDAAQVVPEPVSAESAAPPPPQESAPAAAT